jgi:SAM-dependent methyltransferase
MGKEIELVTTLHQSTSRDYFSRMADYKVECMLKAKEYGADYWDGSRRFGYGGYKYIPGRWATVAQGLIDRYHLGGQSKILDVGCGKGYLLYELTKIIPEISVEGVDISEHAIDHAHPEMVQNLRIARAEDPLPYEKNNLDLVISLGCLHNLDVIRLERSLREMERVSRAAYVMVESYRNEEELFNLQCWALTAETFFTPDEWTWLFGKAGFSGDYEFIFFE